MADPGPERESRAVHGAYRWDYQSAVESPSAPAGTAATYSDSGVGRCN